MRNRPALPDHPCLFLSCSTGGSAWKTRYFTSIGFLKGVLSCRIFCDLAVLEVLSTNPFRYPIKWSPKQWVKGFPVENSRFRVSQAGLRADSLKWGQQPPALSGNLFEYGVGGISATDWLRRGHARTQMIPESPIKWKNGQILRARSERV